MHTDSFGNAMNMATTGNTSVVFRRLSKVPICECAFCMQNHTLNFAYFVAILGVKSLLIAMTVAVLFYTSSFYSATFKIVNSVECKYHGS